MKFMTDACRSRKLAVAATRSVALLGIGLGLLVFTGGRAAWAHQDPPTCSGTAVDFKFEAFRSNGSDLDGFSPSECELITYRITIGKSNIGTPCAFEGGTMKITTPDGVIHNVTPGGGVPCIGGTGACSTTQFSSLTVNYTVNPADVFGGMISATGVYNAAFSHTGPGASHTLNSPNAGGFIQNTVVFCPADTPCTDNFCDPNLYDSATGALGNCTFAYIPNSTQCPDTDGNQCTFAGCNGFGTCDQQHQVTVCPSDNNPCTNDLGCDSASGACIYTPKPDSTQCPDTDGNNCTTAGCNAFGTCDQHHQLTVCPSDNNPCTTDLGCSSPSGACIYAPLQDSTPCPDPTPGNNCMAGCNAFGTCDQSHLCTPTTSTSTTSTSTSTTTSTTGPCIPAGPEAGNCADMIDNDCDGKIDCIDEDCGPTLCSGGLQNGLDCATPATLLACTQGGGTCLCPRIQKDPTSIVRRKRPLLDYLVSHGLISITGPVDVAGSEVGMLLTNARGAVFSMVLPPNTLSFNATRTSFKYINIDARTHGGPYKVQIAVRGTRPASSTFTYRYTIQAYGDLSAATDALMSLQFYIGSQPTPAFLTETWTPKKYGWAFVEPRLPRPPR